MVIKCKFWGAFLSRKKQQFYANGTPLIAPCHAALESAETSSGKKAKPAEEEYSAMQFFCEFDLDIPVERYDMTSRILRGINENLRMGHFDVPFDSRMPYFRHTTLFRGMTHTSGADLMEIALAECEKNYNIFRMLSGPVFLDESLMALALAGAGGRAWAKCFIGIPDTDRSSGAGRKKAPL